MFRYLKMTFLSQVSSCHNQNQGVSGKTVCDTTGLGLLLQCCSSWSVSHACGSNKEQCSTDRPVWLVFFCLVIPDRAGKHAGLGKNVTL